MALLNEACASLLSVAATQMTWLKAHGYLIELSLSLPAAATIVTPAAYAASKVGCIAATDPAASDPPRLMLIIFAPWATA